MPILTAVKPRPANQIAVAQFSLILQWPLVLDANEVGNGGFLSHSDAIRHELQCTAKSLANNGWVPVDGLDMLNTEPAANLSDEERDGLSKKQTTQGYQEYVYFHDFLQRILYPKAEDKNVGVSIWSNSEYSRLAVNLPVENSLPDCLCFNIRRRTIHLYDFGCAMFTLELEHDGTHLTLDRVQRALDYMRRSYAPFYNGPNAGRSPIDVILDRKKDWGPIHYRLKNRDLFLRTWQAAPDGERKFCDAPVYAHWQDLIAPLKLRHDHGPWRDPSDERIPINSYIRLLDLVPKTEQAVLSCIHESDWIRIADAEEPGAQINPAMEYPYNSESARNKFAATFYDRFLPDCASDVTASRHIITSRHYSVVGVGDFAEYLLHDHFRRHYTQMSLIARLEQTALLAVSSRLTAVVHRFNTGFASNHSVTRSKARSEFEANVLDIQDQFLSFLHRFRFTGVTSQVQGEEMFAMWRNALGLDVLFKEVSDELDAAISSVRARQQGREVVHSRELSILAAVAAVVAIFIGWLGANPFVGADKILGAQSETFSIVLAFGLSSILLGVPLFFMLDWRGSLKRPVQVLVGTGAIALFVVVLMFIENRF